MPDEAPAAESEITAALAEFSKRWPDKPATPEAPAKDNPVSAAATSAAGEAPAGDAAATKDNPAATPSPSSDATEDYSHIPEKYREAFKALPPEAQQWAKVATIRRSAHEKQKQELAAEREKQKELLTFATGILGDKKAVDALKALATEEQKAAATPSSTILDAILEGKADVLEAEIDRRVAEKVEAKAVQVEARVKRETGPNPLAVAIVNAHGENYDNVALDAAWKAMSEAYGDGSVEVTEKNAATLIKPFLPKIGQVAAVNKVVPSNGAARGAANGVSPLSRGGGVVAPLAPPPSMAERRPKTRRELIDETLYEIGKQNGNPLTLQDVGARMRGEFPP